MKTLLKIIFALFVINIPISFGSDLVGVWEGQCSGAWNDNSSWGKFRYYFSANGQVRTAIHYYDANCVNSINNETPLYFGNFSQNSEQGSNNENSFTLILDMLSPNQLTLKYQGKFSGAHQLKLCPLGSSTGRCSLFSRM